MLLASLIISKIINCLKLQRNFCSQVSLFFKNLSINWVNIITPSGQVFQNRDRDGHYPFLVSTQSPK